MRSGASGATSSATTDQHSGAMLGCTPGEFERLRAEARPWEQATGRLLDQVELAPGARCLDAGCGPGETMRLMAQRVGPTGEVTGIDVDAGLGTRALAMLHTSGHRQCGFAVVDVGSDEAIPGAPFDLVHSRLVLMSLPDPVAVLRRLWAVVASGGHLIVQDYDTRTIDVDPPLATIAEFRRVSNATITATGHRLHRGQRLRLLLAQAGIGAPDGTDVAGHLGPLSTAGPHFASLHRALLPAAISHGITTQRRANRWLEDFAGDIAEHPDHAALWPMLISFWKHKPLRGPEGSSGT